MSSVSTLSCFLTHNFKGFVTGPYSINDRARLDMKQSKELLVVVVLKGEWRCCLAENRHQVFQVLQGRSAPRV